jgi:hypothetical protein
VIFNYRACKHGDVVLNLDVAFDRRAPLDAHILPEDAAFANSGLFHRVREVPYFRARSDLSAVIDIGGFVHELRTYLFFILDVERFQSNSPDLQSALTGTQDSQDPEPLCAIADRRSSGYHTVKEVLAFRT